MNYKRLLPRMIVLMFVSLLPIACGTSEATPASILPAATNTFIPATVTYTPVPSTATLIPHTSSPEPTPSPSPYPTSIPIPRSRYFNGLVYDSESSLMIVFGGSTGEGVLVNDTWTYDIRLGHWKQIEIESGTGPPLLGGGAMVYDAESDRAIWHGGLTASSNFVPVKDTWSFDANSGNWEKRAVGPAGGFVHQMAYDSESDKVVYFGGISPKLDAPNWDRFLRQGEATGETWIYDWNTDTWTEMEPSASPPPRFAPAMAYHAKADRVILFGGVFDDKNEKDRHVWAYDLNTNTWEQRGVAEDLPLEAVKMVYDAESNQIVLYGGPSFWVGGSSTYVYSFKQDTWTKMSPERVPGKITWHAMTYVGELDRVVLFGGMLDGDYNAKLAEPWLYNYNEDNWLPLSEGPE